MAELATGFQSLPADYRRVIQLAEDQHNMTITPLQELAGGWSGAMIFLVSVAPQAVRPVEHFVLKLDRKSKTAKSDEIARHASVQSKSPPQFVREHLADLAFERVEADDAIGIFYTIAGQSLQAFRPLAFYGQQHQLEAVFAATNRYLLDEWNVQRTFAQAVHPQELLAKWLGFRIEAGAPAETFLRQTGGVDPDTPGFLIQGKVFPNPLEYARRRERWGQLRPIDVAVGLQHGDLNSNNILVKFSEDQRELNGYYLIDFALFKDQMPLLYDQRYLEMSYLLLALSRVSFEKGVDLILTLADADGLDSGRVPIEMAGASAVLRAARETFERWVTARHPSLRDDLWGQYWLAGVAAGLAYCHKAGQPDEQRLAGLMYAAANLKRFAAAFALPLPTEVKALYGEGPLGGISPGRPAPALQNLPASLTPLLGRELEIASLCQLLSQPVTRLVTLIGPGGVGKTSLALRVAHEAHDAFADGAVFISLASISDPTLVLPTIAQALGLPESPRRLWLDSLKVYLQERQMLLLLDNFEQIMSAAPLLSEVLSACAGLRLLVTSREALRLRGEQEYLLSPLPLPDQSSIETLLACPSIALFVQRAQAVQLDFQLTSQNAAAVAEICARLDGLPLALELAAARSKLLPPAAMLAQLRQSPLQLLSRGARDLPERQQTLRRAVQWSYDLLDEAERRAFRWLAVFVGGSPLEAALAVLAPAASVDVLDSLVSKSLLRQTETGGAARLVMLETIREFAWEQSAHTAELEAARRAHAIYWLALAEEAAQKLTSADQKRWLQRLERERDNLRAALRWAIEQREIELAQRLAGALQPFWLTRGYWSEGRRWLEEALALDAGGTVAEAVRAKALYGAGTLARFQGDFARARMLCDQSLTLYRGLADPTGVVEALVELSRISSFQGDQTATQAFLAEADSRLETLPDTVVKASAYSEMVVAMVTPSVFPYPPEAAHYLAESERIHRALSNPTGLALALIRQASSALFGADNSLALAQLDEAERLATDLGDERILSRLASVRVLFDWQAGDFAAARLRLQDNFQQSADRGDHQFPIWLPILAAVLHGQGLEAWSARVFGLVEAVTATRPISAEAAALWQRVGLGATRAEVRAELGDEAYAREIATGQRLTLEDLRTIPNLPGSVSAPPTAPPAPPVSAAAPGTALTARETEVLRLLDQDLSNPQIAERLVVSRRTVDAHLRAIYDKLGVESRAAALRAAHAQGLLGR